jgi:hypothetical protein
MFKTSKQDLVFFKVPKNIDPLKKLKNNCSDKETPCQDKPGNYV